MVEVLPTSTARRGPVTLISSRRVRRVGLAFVLAAVVAGCGTHHRSMEDAVLRYACGDRCDDVRVRLSHVRRADEYATATVESIPAGRIQGDHVLLRRVDGDWRLVDAWSSLAGVRCTEAARQMQVRESILRRLDVC